MTEWLIDKSALARLAASPDAEHWSSNIERGLVRIATVTLLEVGYSARNRDEWDRLAASLGAFDVVETTAEHVERALQVQRLLATRSQRGRKIPDLLVAAAAEALDLTVLHYDADFDLISGATGQPSAWVVAAGSVD